MPRVTHVKHAKQRYETVTVTDDDGTPRTSAVLRKDGTPRLTKSGRAITRTVTVQDRSRPKPNRHCEKCSQEIKVGDPYKWIAPRSGPYGGRKRFRCAACPTWHIWEYSSSLSARLSQAVYEAERALEGADTIDALNAERDAAVESIRAIAEEQRDKSQNVEDGFGHPTSISEELSDQAEEIDSFADDVENTCAEQEEDDALCDECEGETTVDCEECSGTGESENYGSDDPDCDECSASGSVQCSHCGGTGEAQEGDESINEIVNEYRELLSTALGNSPY